MSVLSECPLGIDVDWSPQASNIRGRREKNRDRGRTSAAPAARARSNAASSTWGPKAVTSTPAAANSAMIRSPSPTRRSTSATPGTECPSAHSTAARSASSTGSSPARRTTSSILVRSMRSPSLPPLEMWAAFRSCGSFGDRDSRHPPMLLLGFRHAGEDGLRNRVLVGRLICTHDA